MVVSFSEPLKRMIVALLRSGGLTEQEAWKYVLNQTMKTSPLAILQGKTPRLAMQLIGTEWGRDRIGMNLWTDIAIARANASKSHVVIIDDVRFPSELEAIKSQGGLTIGLERPGVAFNHSHASEQKLDVPIIINDSDPLTVAKTVYQFALAKHV